MVKVDEGLLLGVVVVQISRQRNLATTTTVATSALAVA